MENKLKDPDNLIKYLSSLEVLKYWDVMIFSDAIGAHEDDL